MPSYFLFQIFYRLNMVRALTSEELNVFFGDVGGSLRPPKYLKVRVKKPPSYYRERLLSMHG